MKMWSGRFRQPLDPDFERWQRSFDFDRRLLREELAASRAHAGALKNAGVLSSSELITILQGLEQIADKGRVLAGFSGRPRSGRCASLRREATGHADRRYRIQAAQRPQPQRADCDRPAALRSGRDRSDAGRSGGLARAFFSTAPSRLETRPCPPTPICNAPSRCWSAHWLLAYVEMFLRDADRLADCRKRLNLSPLGSGAVAGATLPLDRRAMAEELGFRCSHRQQHRRHQRSRFRSGVCERAFPPGRAPESLGGGDDFIFHRRSMDSSACRRLIRPAAAPCRKR